MIRESSIKNQESRIKNLKAGFRARCAGRFLAGRNRLRQGYGGPSKLHAKAEGPPYKHQLKWVSHRRGMRRENVVEGRTWTHRLGGKLRVGDVIPADVHRPALHGVQLFDNLRFVLRQPGGERCEARLQLGVLVLVCQRLGPVHGEVEVTAAIVELPYLARRRLAVFEERRRGLVERAAEQRRAGVARG